jgi:hypothetical protein
MYSVHSAEPFRRDRLQNQNQTSELIMDSNSGESLHSVVATEDKEYCKEVLLKPHI